MRFTDTSGWAAWLDQRETFHQKAVAAFGDVWATGGKVVSTNWVLDELTALLISPLRIPKARQIQIFDSILADTGVRILSVDSAVEADAWHLWRSRPDKDWTLTDCTSFVVMQSLGLLEVISADHHFDQAGFVRLLK
jgi:predicted nucleic acid-binding protein